MSIITRRPVQSAEMFFHGALNAAGSDSGHTGYRIAGTGNQVAAVLRFRANCKSIKLKGKFTSADTGASLPRIWVNGVLTIDNNAGNPWYNSTALIDATIWQSGTGIDETVEIAISLVGASIPFYIGTPTAGTTGFDGYAFTLDANGTPTMECPEYLKGTIVQLTKTTSKASPAGGNTQAYEALGLFRQYRLKPNANRVTLLGRLSDANTAWAQGTTRPDLTLAHTGLRQTNNLREQTVFRPEPNTPPLNGSGYKGAGSRDWDTMVVGENLTPGQELWVSLGTTGSAGASALYAILQGDAESLGTMDDYPELMIGQDGGEGNNRGQTPRASLTIGMFGRPWQGNSNNTLLQAYTSGNVRSAVGLFGDDPTYGWGALQTACAAYPGDVNLSIYCFTYENEWDHGTIYFRSGASPGTPYNVANMAQFQEIVERFAPAIRNGNVFPATAAIPNFNRLYVFPFFLMTRGHYPLSDNLVYIDGLEYQAAKGGGYPPAGFVSNADHVDVRDMVIAATAAMNTAGYKALNGTDPFAVYVPLQNYRTFVYPYYNRNVKIPESIDGPWGGGRGDGGPWLSNDRVHPFDPGNGYYSALTAIANGVAGAINSVLGRESSAAPLVLDAWVPAAGDRVRIRFDRDVDGTGTGFSFTVGGVAVAVTPARVSARVLDFVLNTGTIYQGQTVLRSYNAGTGNVKDLYAVSMTGFTSQAVANQSTASTPLDPATAPSISPSGGAVTVGQQITLSSPTPGAVIYYTVDGTDPDNTDTLYNPAAKPTLSSVATVDFRAITYASGYSASPIAYATFNVQEGGARNRYTGRQKILLGRRNGRTLFF